MLIGIGLQTLSKAPEREVQHVILKELAGWAAITASIAINAFAIQDGRLSYAKLPSLRLMIDEHLHLLSS
jgi:hypothetical protein